VEVNLPSEDGSKHQIHNRVGLEKKHSVQEVKDYYLRQLAGKQKKLLVKQECGLRRESKQELDSLQRDCNFG
jgi:ribosomal protein S4